MSRTLALAFAGLALAGCASFPHDAPSNFIVFFSGDSTTLTDDGRAIVKSAATKIRQDRPQSVLISAGAKAGNMELSEPRFAAVRQALVDQGVASDLVARAPLPPGTQLTGAAAAQTGDQRVEIRLLERGP